MLFSHLFLAYLRSNDADAASGVLNPELAQRKGFRDGWKSVIAAMLVTFDETDRARDLVKTINRENLSELEREFLIEFGL